MLFALRQKLLRYWNLIGMKMTRMCHFFFSIIITKEYYQMQVILYGCPGHISFENEARTIKIVCIVTLTLSFSLDSHYCNITGIMYICMIYKEFTFKIIILSYYSINRDFYCNKNFYFIFMMIVSQCKTS